MVINLDDIEIDDICTPHINIQRSVEHKLRSTYPLELDKYEFISPMQTNELCIGDCIRYTKKNNKLSCCSIIKIIKYTNKYIDYICLSSIDSSKMWKIYTSNHFIFKYRKSTIGYALRQKLNDYIQNKNIKLINSTPTLNKLLQ